MPKKSFSLIALPVLSGGVMKDFQNFYRLLWITRSIFIEIQPNFNAKCALHSIIDGANLAEFKVGEGCFLNGLKSVAKKKNTKKCGWPLEPRILGITGPISFKFDIQGNETVGHIWHDFD